MVFKKGHKINIGRIPWNLGKKCPQQGRKGRQPPNKGIPMSEETRFKVAKSWFKKGMKMPKEWIEKHRKAIQGKNNSNWKGGITPKIQKRCGKAKWLHLADLIRKRDNFECCCCMTKEKKRKFPVHHISRYEISKDNSQNNLLTLCNSCHIFIHRII
jgi:hypothetical protein